MIASALASLISGGEMTHRLNTSGGWHGSGGARTTSGVTVTTESALAVSTVFGCVRRLSESISMLPLHVCRRRGAYEEPDWSHPLWPVLHDSPNVWQTSFEWREMGMGHLLLRGNFYNRIIPGARGSVDQLVPLNPDRVTPEQLPGGRILYHHTGDDSRRSTYTQDEILHIRGMCLDGIEGCSVIHYARNAIGLSIAEETAGGKIFDNGGVFLYALETDKRLGQEGRENFRKSWRGIHAGAGKAHNPPVLEDGMKIHELGISLQDSQWIESRGFQAIEICRFFAVPPHMVGILDRATFSNIEEMSLEFVIYTLLPWCKRIESAGERDLVQDDQFVIRFNVDGLLRGDITRRYTAYNTGIQASFLTVNEVRAKENLPPVPGGDDRRVPLNTAPAGEAPPTSGRGDAGTRRRGEDPDAEDDTSAAKAPPHSPEILAAAVATAALTRSRVAWEVLLEDAAHRIAAAEIRGLSARADRAAADRNRFDTWIEEDFYRKHEEYLVRTLAPLCLAWGRLSDRAIEAETVAAAICCAAVQDLRVAGDVPALLAQWTDFRATQLSADLKERFFRVTA